MKKTTAILLSLSILGASTAGYLSRNTVSNITANILSNFEYQVAQETIEIDLRGREININDGETLDIEVEAVREGINKVGDVKIEDGKIIVIAPAVQKTNQDGIFILELPNGPYIPFRELDEEVNAEEVFKKLIEKTDQHVDFIEKLAKFPLPPVNLGGVIIIPEEEQVDLSQDEEAALEDIKEYLKKTNDAAREAVRDSRSIEITEEMRRKMEEANKAYEQSLEELNVIKRKLEYEGKEVEEEMKEKQRQALDAAETIKNSSDVSFSDGTNTITFPKSEIEEVMVTAILLDRVEKEYKKAEVLAVSVEDFANQFAIDQVFEDGNTFVVPYLTQETSDLSQEAKDFAVEGLAALMGIAQSFEVVNISGELEGVSFGGSNQSSSGSQGSIPRKQKRHTSQDFKVGSETIWAFFYKPEDTLVGEFVDWEVEFWSSEGFFEKQSKGRNILKDTIQRTERVSPNSSKLSGAYQRDSSELDENYKFIENTDLPITIPFSDEELDSLPKSYLGRMSSVGKIQCTDSGEVNLKYELLRAFAQVPSEVDGVRNNDGVELEIIRKVESSLYQPPGVLYSPLFNCVDRENQTGASSVDQSETEGDLLTDADIETDSVSADDDSVEVTTGSSSNSGSADSFDPVFERNEEEIPLPDVIKESPRDYVSRVYNIGSNTLWMYFMRPPDTVVGQFVPLEIYIYTSYNYFPNGNLNINAQTEHVIEKSEMRREKVVPLTTTLSGKYENDETDKSFYLPLDERDFERDIENIQAPNVGPKKPVEHLVIREHIKCESAGRAQVEYSLDEVKIAFPQVYSQGLNFLGTKEIFNVQNVGVESIYPRRPGLRSLIFECLEFGIDEAISININDQEGSSEDQLSEEELTNEEFRKLAEIFFNDEQEQDQNEIELGDDLNEGEQIVGNAFIATKEDAEEYIGATIDFDTEEVNDEDLIKKYNENVLRPIAEPNPEYTQIGGPYTDGGAGLAGFFAGFFGDSFVEATNIKPIEKDSDAKVAPDSSTQTPQECYAACLANTTEICEYCEPGGITEGSCRSDFETEEKESFCKNACSYYPALESVTEDIEFKPIIL